MTLVVLANMKTVTLRGEGRAAPPSTCVPGPWPRALAVKVVLANMKAVNLRGEGRVAPPSTCVPGPWPRNLAVEKWVRRLGLEAASCGVLLGTCVETQRVRRRELRQLYPCHSLASAFCCRSGAADTTQRHMSPLCRQCTAGGSASPRQRRAPGRLRPS
jgi:hypothetical protein